MDRRKLVMYGGIPLGVSAVLLLLYFSGIQSLQQIVIPYVEGIYGNSMREFGLLENLQNVVLLVMFVICLKGMRIQLGKLWKVALSGLACFTLLVLLEEIDYGLHYYEYVMGIEAKDAAESRNLHNVRDRTSTIKQLVDLAMLIFFVIMPFALRKSEQPLVKHFLADRYSVITLLVGLIVSEVAHSLNDIGMSFQGIDNHNTSEFRELVTYYLCLLYYFEVIVKRRWGSDAGGETLECNDE